MSSLSLFKNPVILNLFIHFTSDHYRTHRFHAPHRLSDIPDPNRSSAAPPSYRPISSWVSFVSFSSSAFSTLISAKSSLRSESCTSEEFITASHRSIHRGCHHRHRYMWFHGCDVHRAAMTVSRAACSGYPWSGRPCSKTCGCHRRNQRPFPW